MAKKSGSIERGVYKEKQQFLFSSPYPSLLCRDNHFSPFNLLF